MYIQVKAKPGRIAYTSSAGGQLIPTHSYVSVQRTEWINRLLSVHGDIEQKLASAPAPVVEDAVKVQERANK